MKLFMAIDTASVSLDGDKWSFCGNIVQVQIPLLDIVHDTLELVQGNTDTIGLIFDRGICYCIMNCLSAYSVLSEFL